MTVLVGDCLEHLAAIDEASVDSCVTDPPSGISFMGAPWDSDRGGRTQWVIWLRDRMELVLRALRPGAHGFVWALPRTSHWTALALEDAGFELRDSVHHFFGTGFPKSLNVSKAIDKAAGAVRDPGAPYREPGTGREIDTFAGWNTKARRQPTVTTPATAAARQWDGWGTALKPGHEVWWLVRKPFKGTVAGNVQEHGTGALNIDGCRIATDWSERSESWKRSGRTSKPEAGKIAAPPGNGIECHELGRWPPNVLLTHSHNCVTGGECGAGCPVAGLDGQSGVLVSGAGDVKPKHAGMGYGGGAGSARTLRGDTGGASRFFPVFYCSKPSTAEREFGLEAFAPDRWTDGRKKTNDTPRLRDNTHRRNQHPTVKPVDLMRWLIRLITPPGGLVLDPFAGSGTTGIAATMEGARFLGIELDDANAAIARARIAGAHLVAPRPLGSSMPTPERVDERQQDLFGESTC